MLLFTIFLYIVFLFVEQQNELIEHKNCILVEKYE